MVDYSTIHNETKGEPMTKARKQPGYLLHKSSGRAYSRAVDKETGKRLDHYFPGEFNSIESRAAYVAFVTMLNREGPVGFACSCEQLAAMFIEEKRHLLHHDVAATRKSRRASYGQWRLAAALLATYGSLSTAELTPGAIVRLREGLVAEGRIARRHVNDRAAKMIYIVGWGTERDLVPAVTHHGLLSIKPLTKQTAPQLRDPRRVQPVDEKHLRIAARFMSPVVKTMTQFQRLTGCRAGEVVQLSWDHITTDDPAFPGVWYFDPPHHKTEYAGKEKRIFIGPRAQDLLKIFQGRRPLPDALYIFTPRESTAHSYWKRKQKAGKGDGVTWGDCLENVAARILWSYKTTGYANAIGHACKKAGVPRIGTHQLRHALAHEIDGMVGGGREQAGAVLGHTDLNVTAIYTQRNQELAARVMRDIG